MLAGPPCAGSVPETSSIEQSHEMPDELQSRVKDLQCLVCDLLQKNQQLRMELSAISAGTNAS
ncbi:MAG: hypothetical protein BGO25_13720 [Acidobacteriales bacterium 59-55]|nr:MAG: hypothetical protein BGO25_13720 [Acidobacteriales bacterium 59-55]